MDATAVSVATVAAAAIASVIKCEHFVSYTAVDIYFMMIFMSFLGFGGSVCQTHASTQSTLTHAFTSVHFDLSAQEK